jgi:hypothetical protein
LAQEIKALARIYGIERLGFLTLTFADNVTEMKEASRRFKSLTNHVLKARYSRAIAIVERQKSRRLHFHLVVVLNADIRTGCDFEAIEKGDYRSANQVLRSEWAYWRKTAPKYRFGRTELLPVKSTAEGIARYVGKYVSKHIGQREAGDKGARLVRYIGYEGDRKASVKFGWNSDGGWLWRQKLAQFASNHNCRTMDDLQRLAGPHWAYRLQGAIFQTELSDQTVYPSQKVAVAEVSCSIRQTLMRDSVTEFLSEFRNMRSGRGVPSRCASQRLPCAVG